MEAHVDVQDRGNNYGAIAPRDQSLDTDPLLDNAPVTFADLGVHRDDYIVETCVGKRRSFSSLDWKERVFAALSIVSISGATGFFIERTVTIPNESPYETLAIALLVFTVFCHWYVLKGILKEQPYDLIIFSVCTVMMIIYSIVNWALTNNPQPTELPTGEPLFKPNDKAPLIEMIIFIVVGVIILVPSLFHARKYYCSTYFIVLTVGEGDRKLQALCSTIFFTESLFTFDLQLEIALVILVMEYGIAAPLSAWEIVVLVVGVPYSISWCFLGFWSIYTEDKRKVILLLAVSWIEPAYIVYKLVDVGLDGFSAAEIVPIAIIVASVLGLIVRIALCVFMIYICLNFGKGMKKKLLKKKAERPEGITDQTDHDTVVHDDTTVYPSP